MKEFYDRVDDIIKEMGLSREQCLECEVCCRFPDPASNMAPFFNSAEKRAAAGEGLSEADFPGCPLAAGEHVLLKTSRQGCSCPAFRYEDNRCSIYRARPLDCRLYPFILMYDEPGGRVILAADMVCPFIYENLNSEKFRAAVGKLADLLEGPPAQKIIDAPGLVGEFKLQGEPLVELNGLAEKLCRFDLKLSRLSNAAKNILEEYFEREKSPLFNYSFAAVALWQDLFNLHWTVCEDMLLIFAAHDGLGFMMLPPLGGGDLKMALAEGERIMEKLGKDGAGARVQDAGEDTCSAMQALGWQKADMAQEYVYSREALAGLAGKRYAKKRNAVNKFLRQAKPRYREFVPDDIPQAIALLRKWSLDRAARHKDDFYRDQLAAAAALHVRSMRDGARLGVLGRIVEIEGETVAYTFGYPLYDGRSFAVLLEVSDLDYPGAAQFIFREFCRELNPYEIINAGPDSGLPNLAAVKESYRPISRPPVYVMNPPQK